MMEVFVCCVVLSWYGISEDEVEEGILCFGIYLVDDFDVFFV